MEHEEEGGRGDKRAANASVLTVVMNAHAYTHTRLVGCINVNILIMILHHSFPKCHHVTTGGHCAKCARYLSVLVHKTMCESAFFSIKISIRMILRDFYHFTYSINR